MEKRKTTITNIGLGIYFGLVAIAVLSQAYWQIFGTDLKAANAVMRQSGRVSGYAWSSNFGWVKFSSASGATHPYGVTIDPSTNEFSGYAWSSNLGWIYFGPDDTINGTWISSSSAPVYGTVPKVWARLGTNNRLVGWAKALSLKSDEGWLYFGDGNNGSVEILNDGSFSGWAWDGDTTKKIGVGWLSLNSADCDRQGGGPNGFIDASCGGDNATTPVIPYKVIASGMSGPIIRSISAPNRDNIAACTAANVITSIRWTYDTETNYCYSSTDENDIHSSHRTCNESRPCTISNYTTCQVARIKRYQVALTRSASAPTAGFNEGVSVINQDGASEEILYGRTFAATDSRDPGLLGLSLSHGGSLGDPNSLNSYLDFGQRYYVWVRAWDDADVSSEWTLMDEVEDSANYYSDGSAATFTIPPRSLPKVAFSWLPANPSKEEIITFEPTVSTSTTGIAKNAAPTTFVAPDASSIWNWTFDNGNPATSSAKAPKVQFLQNGITSIALTLTDEAGGYSCSTSTTVNANLRLPNWKENNPK